MRFISFVVALALVAAQVMAGPSAQTYVNLISPSCTKLLLTRGLAVNLLWLITATPVIVVPTLVLHWQVSNFSDS